MVQLESEEEMLAAAVGLETLFHPFVLWYRGIRAEMASMDFLASLDFQ